jgi:sugar phosphate isomerase/epimerase
MTGLEWAQAAISQQLKPPFHLRHGRWERELQPGWIGSVGLSSATEGLPKGQAAVSAYFATRSIEFAKTLNGIYRDAGLPVVSDPPTVLITIGQLMDPNPPRWREWLFTDGEDPSAAVAEIVAAVDRLGLPWLESHCSLQAAEAFARYERPDQWQTLVLALALQGRLAEADELMLELERRQEEYGHGQDMVHAWARAFRNRFELT